MMLLTVFLAIVFCGAITLLLISAVAFVQDKRFFSSAPEEAQEVIKPRNKELFYGARAIGQQENLAFLTPHMCVMDYPTIEYKGGKLLRTKTLGAGGDCCDFHVVKGAK